MLDTTPYYDKLAKNQELSQNEILTLLQALKTAQAGVAYLSDCHAATLEGLPKSASNSSKRRLAAICTTAAALIDGDITAIRHYSHAEAAQRRCRSAAASVA